MYTYIGKAKQYRLYSEELMIGEHFLVMPCATDYMINQV